MQGRATAKPRMIGHVVVGVLSGILLGVFFIGGLAWTVRRLTLSDHPGLMGLGSFIIRAVVVVVAFALLANVSPGAFVSAFIAFVMARLVLVRFESRRITPAAGE